MMYGVKYIRQRGTTFLNLVNLLSLIFRLTNAEFSGSRRPGRCRRRLAPLSMSTASASEQSESESVRNGPSGRHGRAEERHKHYNGVCLSDYLASA